MTEDTVKILKEAVRDKIRADLITTTAPEAAAPPILQKIADRLHLLPENDD